MLVAEKSTGYQHTRLPEAHPDPSTAETCPTLSLVNKHLRITFDDTEIPCGEWNNLCQSASQIYGTHRFQKDQVMEEINMLIEQNASILAVLERIADKLEVLDEVKSAVESIDGEVGSIDRAIGSIEIDVESIGQAVGSINEECQWTKDLSTAAQIIKAVEGVSEAVISTSI
jgi:hypothetical protein